MARGGLIRSRLRFSCTPRFEIFYALRALDQGNESTAAWRKRNRRLLPQDFRARMNRVAPHAMMWPLLADVLRDSKPDPSFPEILNSIRTIDDRAFQRAVLGGIFHESETVSALIAGDRSLADAVRTESEAGRPLVSMMGLHPFERTSAVASSLGRIVHDPAGYRADLVEALETFWGIVFSDTWRDIEPRAKRAQEALRLALASTSPSTFARGIGLPIVLNDRNRVVASLRGRTLYPYEVVGEIHVIPSAFNDGRLWAAYTDDSGSVRLYFPVFRAELLRQDMTDVDPATAFRALGDTTRYAIASVLAHEPQTSVELSKAFGVSKATISHHVQLLRAAGLLEESTSDSGIVLALNRETLEEISRAAAEELFEDANAPVIRRSRHERRISQ
ncbi:MAG TPA: winged helix-turn-helix domain-containing protein [Rhodothermia bacterium]|nr:winged helix-turn-helix domain-containing protein [Rhodothermia bacterium]